MTLRPVERPVDLVIDKMIDKLGLLSPEQVEKVVFVYGNIRGFRVGLEVLTREHATMADDEFILRTHAACAALSRAANDGIPLIRSLRQSASRGFIASLFLFKA